MSASRFNPAIRRMTLNAIMVALYIVLSTFLSIPLGAMKITFEALPVVLCAAAFGPLDAFAVGFLGEFLNQMLTFGFTPTTLLWVAPIVLRGLILGFSVMGIKRCLGSNWWKKPAGYAIFMAVGIVASLVHSLVNTIAYYVDSKMFGYYEYHAVFGVMFYRLGAGVISAIVMGMLTASLLTVLKKANLIPEKPAPMTAQQAIEYIHSVCWKDSPPGLERIQTLLDLIGNPQKELKFVHIAGTNGKGSTAAMTASILQQAGYRTGLYTSPYIYRFHERMQVNGQQISDKELAAITQYVKPFAQSMTPPPTEFELVCCIAFEFFKRQKCDIVVLEVGMGGAMDATNVIDAPEVAVITNIGLDHTEYLGDTVEKIAQTKAGIFKEGGRAVIYRAEPGVEQVLEDICAQRNVSLRKADFAGLRLHSCGLDGQVFDCGQRKNLELPLLGDHQLHNAAVVLAIADTLIQCGFHISEEDIRQGLKNVSWPGRFDVACREPLFIIDGGHNPQCIEALEKNIQDYLAGRRIIALTGVLADKDYADMYKPVMPYIHSFVCITPPTPRKLDASSLAEHLRSAGAQATACESIEQGVKIAIELAGKDGVVLCFGSLYTIGEIRSILEGLL